MGACHYRRMTLKHAFRHPRILLKTKHAVAWRCWPGTTGLVDFSHRIVEPRRRGRASVPFGVPSMFDGSGVKVPLTT